MAHYPGTSLADALTSGAVSPAIDDASPGLYGDTRGVRFDAIHGVIHEHQVPLQAIEALDRLHGSLYASYRHFRLCDSEGLPPHTWMGYRQGEIMGALLFRVESGRVRVLTEMFQLDEAVACAFCRDVFARYRQPATIRFNAVSLSARPSTLPCQYFVFSENYVLDLPASVDQYEQALGKSTRKTLRGYGNRLLREHPSFDWRSFSASELSRTELRAVVRQLQEFKRASMAERGRQAQRDVRETARLLELARDCGMLGLGTIDGKLCAGSLACRIGDNYVMLLSASDPAFSAYRLGLLACYWSICDCLQQGARQCHLLWGRYRYKEQLLAVPAPLSQLQVYRSRWHMLLSPLSVLLMTGRGLRHRLRSWVMNEWPSWRDQLPAPLRALIKNLRKSLRSNRSLPVNPSRIAD